MADTTEASAFVRCNGRTGGGMDLPAHNTSCSNPSARLCIALRAGVGRVTPTF